MKTLLAHGGRLFASFCHLHNNQNPALFAAQRAAIQEAINRPDAPFPAVAQIDWEAGQIPGQGRCWAFSPLAGNGGVILTEPLMKRVVEAGIPFPTAVIGSPGGKVLQGFFDELGRVQQEDWATPGIQVVDPDQWVAEAAQFPGVMVTQMRGPKDDAEAAVRLRESLAAARAVVVTHPVKKGDYPYVGSWLDNLHLVNDLGLNLKRLGGPNDYYDPPNGEAVPLQTPFIETDPSNETNPFANPVLLGPDAFAERAMAQLLGEMPRSVWQQLYDCVPECIPWQASQSFSDQVTPAVLAMREGANVTSLGEIVFPDSFYGRQMANAVLAFHRGGNTYINAEFGAELWKAERDKPGMYAFHPDAWPDFVHFQ